MLDISKVMPGWSLEGVLGSGDFGTVYLARNAENGSFSAVKVIKVPPADEAISMAVQFGISRDLLTTYFTKFKNDLSWELAMYGNVKCRNLATVEDTVTVDAQGPGWTGYIRTGIYTPLSTYFEKAAATPEDAARLGEDLANALDCLAQYGMVHGEIKPENVMVTDGGSFVLTDFAVRRTLEKAGSGIFGANTGDFAAPETQAEEHRYTPQSDIYSVGAMMCYVANGCSMPEHNDPTGIRGIDPALAAIIKKAMAADPAARYQTAGQLKIELTRLGGAKKQPRRAMAAAAAFDAVKRNGGAVMTGAPRTEARQTPVNAPETNTQRRAAVAVEERPRTRTEEVPEERVKKSKAGWIIAVAAALVMVAVVLLIWTPWKKDEVDPDAGQHGTIYDDTNQNGSDKNGGEQNSGEQNNNQNGNGQENNGQDSEQNNNEQNNGEQNNNEQNNNEQNNNEQNNNEQNNNNEENNNSGENNENNNNEENNNNGQDGEDEPGGEENTGGNTRPEAVNDDILYPSDTVRMTRAELEGKTRQEVAMLINEIYARHGYIFSTSGTGTVQSYFNSQKWYTPKTSDANAVQKEFNAVETANIRTLTDYRAELNAAGGNTSSGGNTASGGDSGNEQTGGNENQGGSNEQGETGNEGNGSNEQGGSGNEGDTPAKDNTVLFPSDTKLITQDDLAGKTREEVTRILNEIYARHGYIFKTESLKEYFEGQEWYRPVTSNQTVVYGMFNETEKTNSQFIDQYMKDQGWR